MAFRDGDGFIACDCGRPHWGLFGAAGLLLVRVDLDTPHVLLQLRAAWTHGGGTWALPGGALDSHEDPVTAAIREADEEAGIRADLIEVKAVHTDDHGNWSYHTVIAHCAGDAGACAANAESVDVEWVPIDQVSRYDLHPGLGASWPHVHQRVLVTLG